MTSRGLLSIEAYSPTVRWNEDSFVDSTRCARPRGTKSTSPCKSLRVCGTQANQQFQRDAPAYLRERLSRVAQLFNIVVIDGPALIEVWELHEAREELCSGAVPMSTLTRWLCFKVHLLWVVMLLLG